MNFLSITYTSVILALLGGSLKAQLKGLQYPVTHTVSQTDTYFGHQIADPYRWLEPQQSDETRQWINEQNAFTENALNTPSLLIIWC